MQLLSAEDDFRPVAPWPWVLEDLSFVDRTLNTWCYLVGSRLLIDAEGGIFFQARGIIVEDCET